MTIERIMLQDGREVMLIGTAHISKQSIEEVEQAILNERPDAVGIELDNERFMQLMQETKWQQTDISEIVRTGRTYLLLFNILLSNMQLRLGESVGVKPGAEFRAAAEAASKTNSRLFLLDRGIKVTLKRVFSRMGLVEKIRLCYYVFIGFFGEGEKLTAQKIEELKNKDTLSELINELSRKFPSVKEVLVDERDSYIAGKIALMEGKKIAAVVGAGHVEGMQQLLKDGLP